MGSYWHVGRRVCSEKLSGCRHLGAASGGAGAAAEPWPLDHMQPGSIGAAVPARSGDGIVTEFDIRLSDHDDAVLRPPGIGYARLPAGRAGCGLLLPGGRCLSTRGVGRP